MPVVGSHVGGVDLHCETFVDEHCVHAPWSAPLVWQAGVGAEQSASLAHGPHVCVAALQTGVVPPQFALLVHATHAYVVPSSKHTGVAGAQSAFDVHAAHCPP